MSCIQTYCARSLANQMLMLFSLYASANFFLFLVVDVLSLFFFVAAVVFPGDSWDFPYVFISKVEVSFLEIRDSDSTTPNAAYRHQDREETKYRLLKYDRRYRPGRQKMQAKQTKVRSRFVFSKHRGKKTILEHFFP